MMHVCAFAMQWDTLLQLCSHPSETKPMSCASVPEDVPGQEFSLSDCTNSGISSALIECAKPFNQRRTFQPQMNLGT